MINLDSDRWTELNHAYGSAQDIPALLRQLPSAPAKSSTREQEPWFSLWSSLCHQSDVYTASYAALPHIIAAGKARAPIDRAEYLLLAGMIEAMRHKPGSPVIPGDLEFAYHEALQAAIPVTLEALQVESDRSWFQGLLCALSAFRGYPELGAAVDALEREAVCPDCESTFVVPGYVNFE